MFGPNSFYCHTIFVPFLFQDRSMFVLKSFNVCSNSILSSQIRTQPWNFGDLSTKCFSRSPTIVCQNWLPRYWKPNPRRATSPPKSSIGYPFYRTSIFFNTTHAWILAGWSASKRNRFRNQDNFIRCFCRAPTNCMHKNSPRYWQPYSRRATSPRDGPMHLRGGKSREPKCDIRLRMFVVMSTSWCNSEARSIISIEVNAQDHISQAFCSGFISWVRNVQKTLVSSPQISRMPISSLQILRISSASPQTPKLYIGCVVSNEINTQDHIFKTHMFQIFFLSQ